MPKLGPNHTLLYVIIRNGPKHFERALAIDPNYALALTGLSEIEGYYYYFIPSSCGRGIDRLPWSW